MHSPDQPTYRPQNLPHVGPTGLCPRPTDPSRRGLWRTIIGTKQNNFHARTSPTKSPSCFARPLSRKVRAQHCRNLLCMNRGHVFNMGILRSMHSIKSTSSNCAHRFPRHPACWCTLIRGWLGASWHNRLPTEMEHKQHEHGLQQPQPERLSCTPPQTALLVLWLGCGFLAAWLQTRGFANTVTDLDGC